MKIRSTGRVTAKTAFCSLLPGRQLARRIVTATVLIFSAVALAHAEQKPSDGEQPVRRSLKPRTGKAGQTRQNGVVTRFQADPGWQKDRFPEDAVCHETPTRIAEIYRALVGPDVPAVVRYERPRDKSLRIVATGHSFMMPGFKTLPQITKAAGLLQPPLLTHTGGGMTGSARYKWEEENGIFSFAGRPRPKLLASIANAEWDAMLWGPYFQDRPEYYECWINFCLKHNPGMKFYLSDAWPQIGQLPKLPESEDSLTDQAIRSIGNLQRNGYQGIVTALNLKYPGRVYVLPTCDALVLAVEYFHRGELPGVEGIHRLIGGKARSIWRDKIGHLGPGFEYLEGYVFYATLYRRSPELIQSSVIPLDRKRDDISPGLDTAFRKIAWKAVCNHPLTGIVDADQDGIADRIP